MNSSVVYYWCVIINKHDIINYYSNIQTIIVLYGRKDDSGIN